MYIYVLVSCRVIEVIPPFGSDDIRHVGVGEDDGGVRPPRAAEPNPAGAAEAAVHECEAAVLLLGIAAVRRDGAVN